MNARANAADTPLWSADDERTLLDTIDAWVEKSVAPIAMEYDQEDKYPQHLVEEMKELGLFGATIAQQYGGLGLPAGIYAKIVTRIASVWMAPTGIINSHLIMASAIERCGTEAQKRKYLPRMATGELRGGLGLTEPNAGTDLQAIRTVAKREGDHYVVNGAKTWITNSLHGDMVLLLVKTDPGAQPRYKGMSMLIAEKRDEGALRLSLRYAQERKAFGKPICEHQAIQLKLGEMATRVEASKLLIESAARAYDSGARCDMEAGMAKYFATETGAYCAQEGMRIFGGYSYSTEYEIERFYRDAMLMCIGEGTNEMQRIIISKQLVARNPI